MALSKHIIKFKTNLLKHKTYLCYFLLSLWAVNINMKKITIAMLLVMQHMTTHLNVESFIGVSL